MVVVVDDQSAQLSVVLFLVVVVVDDQSAQTLEVLEAFAGVVEAFLTV